MVLVWCGRRQRYETLGRERKKACLSSSAQADDPVSTDGAVSTGCSAFAEHDRQRNPSCPHSLRASTSFDSRRAKDVDGRDKPDHDGIAFVARTSEATCGVATERRILRFLSASEAHALTGLFVSSSTAWARRFAPWPSLHLLFLPWKPHSRVMLCKPNRLNSPRYRIIYLFSAKSLEKSPSLQRRRFVEVHYWQPQAVECGAQ